MWCSRHIVLSVALAAVTAASCAPADRVAPNVVPDHHRIRGGSLKDTPVVQRPRVSDRQPRASRNADDRRLPPRRTPQPQTELTKQPGSDEAEDGMRPPECGFDRIKSAYLNQVRLQTPCACEIFRARDQSRCGGRSAEHRAGGDDPMCPTADVFRTGIRTQIFASGCERHIETLQRETDAYIKRSAPSEDVPSE